MRRRRCIIAKFIVEDDKGRIIYNVKDNGMLDLPKKRPRKQIDMKYAILKKYNEIYDQKLTLNSAPFPIPQLQIRPSEIGIVNSDLNKISSDNQSEQRIAEFKGTKQDYFNDFHDFDDVSYFYDKLSQTTYDVF